MSPSTAAAQSRRARFFVAAGELARPTPPRRGSRSDVRWWAVFLNGSNTNVTNSGTIGSSCAHQGQQRHRHPDPGRVERPDHQQQRHHPDRRLFAAQPESDHRPGVYGQWSNVTTPQNNYGIRLIAPGRRQFANLVLRGRDQQHGDRLDHGQREQFLRHLDRNAAHRRWDHYSNPPSPAAAPVRGPAVIGIGASAARST